MPERHFHLPVKKLGLTPDLVACGWSIFPLINKQKQQVSIQIKIQNQLEYLSN